MTVNKHTHLHNNTTRWEDGQRLRISPPVGSMAINQLNGMTLGEIINLSDNGFMLSSRSKIEPEQLFQLQLRITGERAFNCSVGVECMWSEDQGKRMVLAGFYIMDISAQDQLILKRFIAQSADG